MQQLTIRQRQFLKGLAHNLQPVVMIGNNGLTDAVIREIEINLAAHELIKIRVLSDDREQREILISEIVARTTSHFVQHIGKLIILYKANDKLKINLPKE